MKRNKHSLSHYSLFTADMGELIPCGLVEVLPGDSIQAATSILLRCQPMVTPAMHPVDVRIHHWYVPHRLVWPEFEDMITGGPAGVSLPTFPTITMPGSGGAVIGSLADYLGVPTAINSLAVSALPFRGYALIWNEWYRDQDLETELVVNLASGVDATTSTALQNCAWEKDYFTSARPWEQKGPSISIPLTGNAPVKGIGFVGNQSLNINQSARETTPLASPRNYANASSNFGNAGVQIEADTNVAATTKPLIYADLSGISAVTVNALREALALQRFEEARARYGSRYTEYLRYLGVPSSDGRLQRPEYLGGGRQTIQFSEVLQTAEGTNPVGTLRGHGISAVRSNRYRRFIEEHGYIFTFMSARPKTIYMQGLKRHWNRRDKEDFWQRELEHIGQQPIRRKEVYAGAASPDATFGYQDMYDEYRREESRISGEFRTTLNSWHFGRSFGAEPSLNASFVKCVPPENPFAVPSTDVLWCMAKHSIQARRLVAKTGSSFIF